MDNTEQASVKAATPIRNLSCACGDLMEKSRSSQTDSRDETAGGVMTSCSSRG
jgi:hypothetical protein